MFDNFKRIAIVFVGACALAGCASGQPRVIQASVDATEIRLTSGMATQIEMPDSGRVQSVVVGNPSLVTATRADDVVNLVPKEGAGETNLIVRALDGDGDPKIYQYRLIVSGQ